MDYRALYQRWLDRAEDADVRRGLEAIAGDDAAIKERFYSPLEFGTAGLRGIMDAGVSRMNVYTVRQVTQGLADYINECFGGGRVAISCDTRNNSRLFAEQSAAVLAANGIEVRLFPDAAPTPMLSFAVRSLECRAGIMITASHNPAAYNGYKVYSSDGCQLGVREAAAVYERITRVDCFDGVKYLPFNPRALPKNVEYIGARLTERYYSAVLACSAAPNAPTARLNVVYTPLHGTGFAHVVRLLNEIGVGKLNVVECQRDPDGDFTTCEYPNPETRKALEQGLLLCEQTGADILLATDPDADRVGVAVRTAAGYQILTGNEVGALLLDFIAGSRRARRTMPTEPVAVKSLVSTPLADRIAAKHSVEMRTVLTGFKNIGEQILLLEQAGHEERFIFGFEESCGYLAGSYVRDKDAMVACMLICELAAKAKARGRTLVDLLDGLYSEFGFFITETLNFSADGLSGMQRIRDVLAGLRAQPPVEFAGSPVVSRADYMSGVRASLLDNTVSSIELERSDILEYDLENGSKIIIRPSGTEPKLKAYLTVNEPSFAQSAEIMLLLKQEISEMLNI